MVKQRHEEYLKSILANIDETGKLKSRESNNIEFKENFNKSNYPKYAKTMASYSNNRGGYIVFGVTDKPRTVKGMQNANFDNMEQEKFTETLNSFFSPEIEWECGTFTIITENSEDSAESKKIGWIYTEESLNKPVIAQKNCDGEKFSNGDILYRYRARSQKIKYSELNHIIEENVRNERDRLFKLFDTIRKSETANLGIVNYTNGKFTTPYGIDVEFDRKLVAQVLKKAKFIKEGSFNETEGIPVIKVTGNIDLAEEVPVLEGNPDETYPYRQKDLSTKLGINTYEITVLIHHYNMKENKAQHIEISSSAKSKLHKYSEYALKFLQKKLQEHPIDSEEFKEMKAAYTNRNTKGTNNG